MRQVTTLALSNRPTTVGGGKPSPAPIQNYEVTAVGGKVLRDRLALSPGLRTGPNTRSPAGCARCGAIFLAGLPRVIKMTWRAMIEIFRRELDGATAKKLGDTIKQELGGKRLTVPGRIDRPQLTESVVRSTLRDADWDVDEAAKKLGVHRTTIYRWLQPKRPRTQSPPPGTYQGRLIR